MISPGFLEVSRAKARAKTVRVVLQKFPGKRCFVLMVSRICAGRAGWERYCLILGILLLKRGLTRKTLAQRYRRSEEHTSELQSRGQLVCRLVRGEKKGNKTADYQV